MTSVLMGFIDSQFASGLNSIAYTALFGSGFWDNILHAKIYILNTRKGRGTGKSLWPSLNCEVWMLPTLER